MEKYLKIQNKMSEKICRLCFKEDSQPIEIFSAKGVKLKIAIILRIHFPDEVNTHI